MKQIVICIDPRTGTTTVETKGYQGKACLADTLDIEDALGIESKDKRPTAEMYRVPLKATVKAGGR